MTQAWALSVEQVSRANDLFVLGSEVLLAFKDIDDTASEFQDALRFAHELAAGNATLEGGSRWQKLASTYRDAADKLQKQSLPTAFDESRYSVSWRDFAACHTRDQSLLLLDGYSAELNAAAVRGAEMAAKLTAQSEDLASISAAVTELVELLENVPLLLKVEWDWYDLRVNVGPSAAELKRTIDGRRMEIAAAIERLKARKDNLDQNIDDLRKTECWLVGRWVGTINIEGTQFPMTLEITGEPANYSLVYSLNGKTASGVCIEQADGRSRRIVFRPSCQGPGSIYQFSLSVSEAYDAVSGVETDTDNPEAKIVIDLRRQ
ncbi:hypothetical protein [Sinorhizobium sp. Sb3]|uniref:hypothetical protein n=1 Tax=Sinorhizobium sp. Sb3 TaxID=1358417 RepID=UPI0012E35FD2|nr:hypothetical protein [Sinorhizobium sp. Sb3]